MKKFVAVFWDIVANIGGLAGLIALAYPVYSLVNKPEVNANPDLHQLVVFTCWILGIAFAGVLVLVAVQWQKTGRLREFELQQYRIETLLENQRDIAISVHNIAHDVRNQIIHLLFAEGVLETIDKRAREEVIERIEKNWGMFNLYFLDNIKNVFDTLTGKNNSVCLKMVRTELVQSVPEPRTAEGDLSPTREMVKTVRTLYRDTQSHRLRRENDVRLEKYVANSNSAFAHILSNDTRNFFYLSNDLAKDQSYVNTNPRWREFYNATMVSPVRIENFTDPKPAETEKYITWGFLCVDSMKATYRQDVELELLEAFADLYFPLLYAFDAWRKAAYGSRELDGKKSEG